MNLPQLFNSRSFRVSPTESCIKATGESKRIDEVRQAITKQCGRLVVNDTLNIKGSVPATPEELTTPI